MQSANTSQVLVHTINTWRFLHMHVNNWRGVFGGWEETSDMRSLFLVTFVPTYYNPDPMLMLSTRTPLHKAMSEQWAMLNPCAAKVRKATACHTSEERIVVVGTGLTWTWLGNRSWSKWSATCSLNECIFSAQIHMVQFDAFIGWFQCLVSVWYLIVFSIMIMVYSSHWCK